MKTIEIDDDIYHKLGEIAKPFVETTPRMVIRRLLDNYNLTVINTATKTAVEHKEVITARADNLKSCPHVIELLREATPDAHPGFLTF